MKTSIIRAGLLTKVFTLIELIGVLVVVGIVAGLLISRVFGFIHSSRSVVPAVSLASLQPD